jgi:hypothetical protein
MEHALNMLLMNLESAAFRVKVQISGSTLAVCSQHQADGCNPSIPAC